MNRLSVAAALFLLAACGGKPVKSTPEPIVVTQIVKVPVVGTCVPANFPLLKTFPDTTQALIAAKDAAERYQLVVAGRQLRDSWIADLQIVVAGCPKAEK